jgi:hypothetical protein
METLFELVDFADKQTVLALLRRKRKPGTNPSRLEKFYLLLEGSASHIDEDEIVEKLFDGRRNKNYSGFRRLKRHMYSLLCKAIYSDTDLNSPIKNYNEAYRYGYANLALVNMLIESRKYQAVLYLSEKTFNKIKEYEIIRLNEAFSFVLMNGSKGVFFDRNRYAKYKEINDYYRNALQDQMKLIHGYDQLKINIYEGNNRSAELSRLANSLVDELHYLKNEYPKVSLIQSMLYQIEIYKYLFDRKYLLASSVAQEGIDALKKCEGISTITADQFDLSRIECTIYNGAFDEGENLIESFKKRSSKNTINWVKAAELGIRLGLATKRYGYSISSLQLVSWDHLKRLLQPIHHEYWRILEAFVHLLVVTKQVEPAEDLPKLRPFRLNRFLNSIQNYEKNKHGLYVQVLILQMMFLIARREYNKVMDRVEGFDRFRRRYLKEKREFRNNCFYRLILKAVDANFNRVAAERMGKPILEKMINSPELEHREISDIEWIPYEDLWEILLGTLDSKRRVRAAKRSA